MFLDEVKITVKGGNGGRGCVSWRREKFVAKGGPDGGDGGNGGNVFLIADNNTDTLSHFSSKKRFEAKKGRFGMGKNKRGKDGDDLFLNVPPGTVVYKIPSPLGRGIKGEGSGEGTPLADLSQNGDQVLIARGGKGGFGNAHFKSSTRQQPDFAELGEPGEGKKLQLELKLVADVGIIGYPSVGKSTLISAISAAKPKIGDYPFTTLVPNLGVVNVDERSYVVCDVPGLIEGAAYGKGLGHQFLKHIERCGVLLHLLDITRDDIIDDYKKLRMELTKYSSKLAEKRELIVLNKTDLVQNEKCKMKNDKFKIFATISAATHEGTEELKKKLLTIVLNEREQANESFDPSDSSAEAGCAQDDTSALPVLQPLLESNQMGAYRIQKDGKKTLVTGRRIEQFTKMTDFRSQGAISRFRDVFKRIGLFKALKDPEGEVWIGDVRVDEYL